MDAPDQRCFAGAYNAAFALARAKRPFRQENRLPAGAAGKLAGALSWAATNSWDRVGRALLRPLFAQSHAASGRLRSDTRAALHWWREVLSLGLRRVHEWDDPPTDEACRPLVHTAHRDRARNARQYTYTATLQGIPRESRQLCFWTGSGIFPIWPRTEPHLRRQGRADAGRVSSVLVSQAFNARNDAQIMGLEMLSIALALSTWAALLHRRKAVIFSDNTGAEAPRGSRTPPQSPAAQAGRDKARERPRVGSRVPGALHLEKNRRYRRKRVCSKSTYQGKRGGPAKQAGIRVAPIFERDGVDAPFG